MTAGLTPRARRMADLIGVRRTSRTRLAELWTVLDQADPATAGSVERRRLLADALSELVAAGLVTPSAGIDRTGHPPLPRHVDRVAAGSAPPGRSHAEPWHSELAWAAERRLTTAQEAVLRSVNRWLFRGGTRAAASPLRERAWEITGDEKAFDSGLVADGVLTLAVLRAYRADVRLHTERVGTGPVCLVVENADTFDSLHRVLTLQPGAVGWVAWGAGAAFGASVLSLRADPPGAIRYFGDLDPAGLRIPAGADTLARKNGLPPVQPATGLYSALLKHGVPRARFAADGTSRAVPFDRARELVVWMDSPHRDQACAVLVAGTRMAQEAVGLALLRVDDGWRAGLAD